MVKIWAGEGRVMVGEGGRKVDEVGMSAMVIAKESVWTWVLSWVVIPCLNERMCRIIEKCFPFSLISK